MSKANGNGSGLKQSEQDLVEGIFTLCDTMKVEVLKLEGLARAVMHRRVVPSRPWRSQFSDSLIRMGREHLALAERAARG